MLSLFAAEVLPNDANLRSHNSAISLHFDTPASAFLWYCGTNVFWLLITLIMSVP